VSTSLQVELSMFFTAVQPAPPPRLYRRRPQPARPRGIGRGLILWDLALAVTLVAVVGAAVLGGEESSSSSSAEPTSPRERDMKLALRARKALQGHKDLMSLNLGVRSQAGVLILWGPVPSAELESKAVQLLRQLPGVRQVQSELYLAADNRTDPIPVPGESGTPTKTQSASVEPTAAVPPGTAPLAALPQPPGQLMGRTPVIALPPSGRGSSAGPNSGPERKPDPPEAPVRLLGPVAAPAPTPPAPAGAGRPGVEALSAAVERVRQGDARFRQVTVAIEGAAVYVGGGGAPAEHVMALARALSGLPGVERVVVRTGQR
jgi:hyperosmotically inducible protein